MDPYCRHMQQISSAVPGFNLDQAQQFKERLNEPIEKYPRSTDMTILISEIDLFWHHLTLRRVTWDR